MLEQPLCLVLTEGVVHLQSQQQGAFMTKHSESDHSDSAVDAKAIFMLIIIAVATAVFWVSGQ